MREFVAHYYGNEITYGLILAFWLLWGGIGSLIANKIKYSFSTFTLFYYSLIFFFPFSLIFLRYSRFIYKILPGEITGILPILITSLFLTLLICFPLGALFVLNVKFFKGKIALVYLMEALGSSIGGVLTYFLLIPFFSNWNSSLIIIGFVTICLFLLEKGKRKIYAVLLIPFILFLIFLDKPTQKHYWKPFNFIESKDTLYGKLSIIKTEEQLSLYDNGLLVYSYPDIINAEEAVHFALIQRPNAKSLLLIGGGIGGAIAQALKYKNLKIEYVELDPQIIKFSMKYLPEKEKKYLKGKRVKIYFRDGRAFLNNVKKKYDVIILNLPEPSTAQINRFYTYEFFKLVKQKLSKQGVFSFKVSSSENYINLPLQKLLSSLYFTLKKVFKNVEVVPGDTNIFIGSDAPVTLDYMELGKRIEKLQLNNMWVNSYTLFSRLMEERINSLYEKIKSKEAKINLDLVPISYFYNSILWATHFKGLESKILTFFSEIPKFWLLDFPLILFLIILFIIILLKRVRFYSYLLPVWLMGFTTISLELIIIIAFQVNFGYVYQKIALLFSAFMFGLFCGALLGKKIKKIISLNLIFIQFCFMVLTFIAWKFIEIKWAEIFPYIFLFLMGFLGGLLFVVANELFLKKEKNYGIGYALDLFGSFLGALTLSTILIPLIGLPLLTKYIFLANSFCFLFLIPFFRTQH
ncbi:fused MFS/spermidine synthase [SCandidatus Aminicenantes bacterium Aminicenantia_JdfR_composite]|jgi:spermidine synthase|nr:fused MFS/spermidine synthase [SCandidatus Aminicenantes bacterium Aminicenantia_JdfR_composite]MCP2606292.1 fused MFS/spermidine synthase [Candidatus Aminicenantes bacterium AC-708-I09]